MCVLGKGGGSWIVCFGDGWCGVLGCGLGVVWCVVVCLVCCVGGGVVGWVWCGVVWLVEGGVVWCGVLSVVC